MNIIIIGLEVTLDEAGEEGEAEEESKKEQSPEPEKKRLYQGKCIQDIVLFCIEMHCLICISL